jgi:CRISPR-associated protein Cmr1
MQLITPMYGGGAENGVNDPDFPIRPTSVRGHLRFWWRATRGAKFKTAEELFDEESKIWGSTDMPSSTVVKVNSPRWDNRRLHKDNYDFKRFGPEAYVLFPAAAATSRHDLVKEGLSFKMEISCKAAFEKDILCAVWAWSNFGGIGARTRRGCGALCCKDMAPRSTDPRSVREWLDDAARKYELRFDKGHHHWTTLSDQILIGSAAADPLRSWAASIAPMRAFRQDVEIGRNTGSRDPKRPGRSRWPEPDTLRRAFNQHSIDHAPAPTDKMPNGFPRAAFGLPIIFQFGGSRGDPSSELYPETGNRMGSPLLLRPLSAGDGVCAPMIVLLNAPMADKLKLKKLPKEFGQDDIVNPEFAAYPNSPMNKRSTGGSAIEAFLAFLRESRQGFRAVRA